MRIACAVLKKSLNSSHRSDIPKQFRKIFKYRLTIVNKMIKTPCEIMLWAFLPSLRRELVKSMIKKGIQRKKIAKTFNITESAICQYLKSKRGIKFKFDKVIQKQIEKSATRISKSKKKETVIFEICRFCSMLKKQKIFCKLHHKENPFLTGCKSVCLR